MTEALGWLGENKEWLIPSVTTVFGGVWLAKIKKAVESVKRAIAELEQDKALLKKVTANGVIDPGEAQALAKELGETLVSVHESVGHIMSIVPEKWRGKVPIQAKV